MALCETKPVPFLLPCRGAASTTLGVKPCVCQVRAEVAPSPTLTWKLLGRQVEGWRPADEGAGPWVAGSGCDFSVG